MKIVLKLHVSFFYTFREISDQRALWSGRFIVLNDSANYLGHTNLFQFSLIFLKVLELIECRRDDPCMTANRNFVRFAHS